MLRLNSTGSKAVCMLDILLLLYQAYFDVVVSLKLLRPKSKTSPDNILG